MTGFCINCGEPHTPTAKFCANCGAERLTPPAESTDDVPLPPPPPSVSVPRNEHDEADVPLPPPPPSAVARTAKDEDDVPLPPPPPSSAATVAGSGSGHVPLPAAPVSPPPTAPPPPAVLTPRTPSTGKQNKPSKPRPARATSPNRNHAIVAGVVVGLVISAVGGVAYAKSSDSKKPKAAAAAAAPPVTTLVTTLPPVTTAPSTTRPTTAPPTDLQPVFTQLDAKLSESATQLGQLKNIIGLFDPSTAGNAGSPCALSSALAAQQTQSIIDSRKSMIGDLDSLRASTRGTGNQLVTLLRSAIGLSLQSDYAYQGWMKDGASTDSTNPCRRAHAGDSNYDTFQSLAQQAGAAKQEFLAAYLPAAASHRVRADWKYTDF